MKGTLLSLFLTASLPLAHARTWTSSDGEKTFEGELQSYDAATGKVTVLIGGRVMSFDQSKLSEADITYLTEWKPADLRAGKDNSAELKSQKVGKKLTEKVLSRLEGKHFMAASLEKTPKYYLLYFSASW